MRTLLPAKVIGRFVFIRHQPHDMLNLISLDAIPTSYRGERAICTGDDYLSNGCFKQKDISKSDYVVRGEVWRKHLAHGMPQPPRETHYLASGASHTKEFPNLKKGQLIMYEYLANREYEISLSQGTGLLLD
jgi:hypothetical protein